MAELGDGGRDVGRHLSTPEPIVFELFRLCGRDWQIERKKGEILASAVLRTGLVLELSALTLEYGGPLSPSRIGSHERLHRELLQTDFRYGSAVSELTAAALRSCHRAASQSPTDLRP